MLTDAGSGYSRWHNLDVTRWHEDVTCDNWGSYIFLRDMESGEQRAVEVDGLIEAIGGDRT